MICVGGGRVVALIMFTASVEGVLYLNGHFAGEVRLGAPLFRPVRAYGALFLEFRPLAEGYLPLTRRLAFASGRPVAQSIADAAGVSGVMWPFGVTEIELAPEAYIVSAPETYALNYAGRAYRLIRSGARARLEIDAQSGTQAFDLPDGANPPVFAEADALMYLSGDTDRGERYALALTRDASAVLLNVVGGEIAFLGEGRLAVTHALPGSARRARRTVYAYSDGAYTVEAQEILPPSNGESAPDTPAKLALACVEAAQLGLEAEARGYFVPGAYIDPAALDICAQTVSAALPRFSPPSGENAVCALKLAGDRLLEAIPLYYRAETYSGAWRLTELRAQGAT